MSKKTARIRRGKRTRAKMSEIGVNRLCVHRTSVHIYAQIVSPTGDKVLASASTVDKEVRDTLQGTGNIDAASTVGKLIAERAKSNGIDNIAFDRSGFKYHGRVKALADAAREAGLQF